MRIISLILFTLVTIFGGFGQRAVAVEHGDENISSAKHSIVQAPTYEEVKKWVCERSIGSVEDFVERMPSSGQVILLSFMPAEAVTKRLKSVLELFSLARTPNTLLPSGASRPIPITMLLK